MRKIIAILATLFAVNAVLAAKDTTIYTEDKTAIRVAANEPSFIIKLKSNPTTGYSWFLRSYDVNYMQPVKHGFEGPSDKKLLGAPGYELWTFKVKPSAFVVPVQTTIRFVYARPWETDDKARQVVFLVST